MINNSADFNLFYDDVLSELIFIEELINIPQYDNSSYITMQK